MLKNYEFDRCLLRGLLLTSHAMSRSVERRISIDHIFLVFCHGDLRFPASAGRTEWQMSHQAAMRLRREGIGPKNIRLLTDLVLIVAESGPIVTVFHR